MSGAQDEEQVTSLIADVVNEQCHLDSIEDSDYRELITDFLEGVTDELRKDGAWFFYYFNIGAREDSEKNESFKLSLKSLRVDYRKFERFKEDDRRSITKKEAEIVMCCSAHVHGVSLKHHFAGYLDQHRQHHPCIQAHEDTIKRLLRECGYTTKNSAYSDRFKTTIYRHIHAPEYYKRQELFEHIEAFIDSHDRGYVTIEGGAGSGKSSIISEATQHFSPDKYRVIWHFNSHTGQINRTKHFVQTLYEGLSEYFDLETFKTDYQQVQETELGAPMLIEDLLNQLPRHDLEQQPLVILVDALDEVDENDPVDSGNLLAIPKQLPANVYLIASSRSFDKRTTYQNKCCPIDLSITSTQSFQKNDIKHYLAKRFENKRVAKWVNNQEWSDDKPISEQFIDVFCTKSEYVFVYLFHVFNDIGSYTLDALPDGLDAYYEEEYRRLLRAHPDQTLTAQKVLAAISNFKPDLSIDRVSYYCEEAPHFVSNFIEHWLRIRLVIDDLHEGTRYLRFFHLSFYEFLEDTAKYQTARELLEAKTSQALHQKLALGLCREFSIDGQKLKFASPQSTRKRQELFRNIFPALLVGNELKTLSGFITDPAFCIALIEHAESVTEGQEQIIYYLEKTYDAFMASNDEEQADALLKNYIASICTVDSETAIISSDKMEHEWHLKRETEIREKYYTFCSQEIKNHLLKGKQ